MNPGTFALVGMILISSLRLSLSLLVGRLVMWMNDNARMASYAACSAGAPVIIIVPVVFVEDFFVFFLLLLC